MADPTPQQKRSYPYVSTNVWAELKSRFQKSLPTKVTPSYLKTVLGFQSDKAAKNLIPQLRLIGLIDEQDAPTELAKRFRMDTEYPAATVEILEAVYPGELRDIYPGPEEDVSQVANWIMNDTGGGQSSALIQARFYVLLASAKLPASDKPAGTVKPSTSPAAKAKPASVAKPKAKPDESVDSQQDRSETPPSPRGGPGLHIDIQIHIDSAASAEQIDSVFSSMAKHLYGRE